MPALERLDQAIARLETALDGRLRRFGEEKAALLQALHEARAKEAQTRSTAETVSARLDSAIERLQTVLEE